ncbi:MAG: dephospho-CoA kinase [Pseudomonadota bacterium]
MWILGLTGSIGMGKSATAALFGAEGVPVHDADAAVHDLYATEAVAPVEAAFPGVARDGVIDRPELSRRVLNDADAMKRLEAIVHPLVRARETAFLARARASGARLVVLDIPLLLETGSARRMDAVAVVSAPADVQRDRVLARPDMTEERFALILRKQMPDAEKRRRAHFIIDTGRGFDAARHQVRGIVRALSGPGRRAGGSKGHA